MVTPKIVENGGEGDWAKRAEIMDSSMGRICNLLFTS